MSDVHIVIIGTLQRSEQRTPQKGQRADPRSGWQMQAGGNFGKMSRCNRYMELFGRTHALYIRRVM